MSKLYAFDITGKSRRPTGIGARLGGGGEGTIYQDATDPSRVIKILTRKDTHSQEKIEAMLANPPSRQVEKQGGREVIQIAWPLEIVVDENGFAGFSMRRIDFNATVSLGSWFDRRARQSMSLADDDRIRVYMAHNLAAVTEFVHSAHHVIVDMKPANIRAYREGGFVCLVDCDGFSVHGGHRHFPSRVWTAEYSAPETFIRGWSVEQANELQDRFSLAVLILMLINDGRHPADGVSDTLPADRQGRLALGEVFFRNGGTLKPPPASHHAYFKAQTTEYFTRAFCGRPEDRPSAREWKEHLRSLSASLVQCSNNPAHWHYGVGCAWCALNGGGAPIQMSAPTPSRPGYVPPTQPITRPATPRPPPASPKQNATFANATPSPPVATGPSIPGIAGLGGSPLGVVSGGTIGPIGGGTPRRPLPRWLVVFVACVMIVPVWRYFSHPKETPPADVSAAAASGNPKALYRFRGASTVSAMPPNDASASQLPARVPDSAIAAIQANVHDRPDYHSQSFVLTRGTQVSVVATDGKFSKIATSDARSGWIQSDLLVPSGAVAGLSSTSASAYLSTRSQLTGNTVASQSQNSIELRKQILGSLNNNLPSVNDLLQALQLANHMRFDQDIAAARWYGLESDAAKTDKRYTDAMDSARAAISADPSNQDNYVRLGWAAYYARDPEALKATAYDLMALAPLETNTWLLVGVALMSGEPKFPIAAANAVALCLQLSHEPKNTRRVLRDLKAGADLDTQVMLGSALAQASP